MHKFTQLLILGALCGIATAQANPERGERRGPPPEAIDACVDKVEDDACWFTHHDHEVEGTCMPGPRPELPLACRPEGGPPPPPPAR